MSEKDITCAFEGCDQRIVVTPGSQKHLAGALRFWGWGRDGLKTLCPQHRRPVA